MTLTPSSASHLPPQPPQLIQGLNALSNEPEVTSLPVLGKVFRAGCSVTWKRPCRCGESGRGVCRGKKLAVPARGERLAPAHSIWSQTVSQCFKCVESLRWTLTSRHCQFFFRPLLSPLSWKPLPRPSFLLPSHRYLAACGKLNLLMHVIALMKACLISIFFVCSSQIVPRSLVATRDL